MGIHRLVNVFNTPLVEYFLRITTCIQIAYIIKSGRIIPTLSNANPNPPFGVCVSRSLVVTVLTKNINVKGTQIRFFISVSIVCESGVISVAMNCTKIAQAALPFLMLYMQYTLGSLSQLYQTSSCYP